MFVDDIERYIVFGDCSIPWVRHEVILGVGTVVPKGTGAEMLLCQCVILRAEENLGPEMWKVLTISSEPGHND